MEPRDLIGKKNDDPADTLACMHERYCTLAPGVSPYDWESAGRQIPNPPTVEEGSFTELYLSSTPAAAWAGLILRRAASSEQPIWQILKDVRRYPVYRIEAPGVRMKDRHSDSRLIGGLEVLRKEGEEAQVHEEDRALVPVGAVAASEDPGGESGTSKEWQTLDRYFCEPIAAVVLPNDSPHPTIRLDWPAIGSIPRLDALAEDGLLNLVYLGKRRMRIRDLMRLTDASGRSTGRRFSYFLARELAHDFFSPRRKRSIRDWITLLAALGAIAGLASRILDLLA